MSEYVFPCPACKKEVKSDTQYIGRAAECPNCQSIIEIPELPSAQKNSMPENFFSQKTSRQDDKGKIKNKIKKTFSLRIEQSNQCELCQNLISPTVAQCPACGHRPKFIRQMKLRYIVGLCLILLGFGIGPLGNYCADRIKTQAESEFKQFPSEFQIEEEITEARNNFETLRHGITLNATGDMEECYRKLKRWGSDSWSYWDFTNDRIRLKKNAKEQFESALRSFKIQAENKQKQAEAEFNAKTSIANKLAGICSLIAVILWIAGGVSCIIYVFVSFWCHWMRF